MMKKEDLIREFETNVIQITNNCLTRLEEPDTSKTVEIFEEFQKSVADETPKIMHKAIKNNVDDRVDMIKILAEIAIKYASKLNLQTQ